MYNGGHIEGETACNADVTNLLYHTFLLDACCGLCLNQNKMRNHNIECSLRLVVLLVLAVQPIAIPSAIPIFDTSAESSTPQFTELELGSSIYKNIVLSEDLKHVGWLAEVDGNIQLFFDERPVGDAYKSIWGLSISPNRDHVAFIIREGNDWRVIRDGKVGPQHVDIKQVTLFETVAGTTYSRKDEDNGRPPGPATTFSPDGSRMAYSALNNGKWRVYVDGKAGQEFDEIGTDRNLGIVFSQDSKHVAYTARQADKWRVVLDGRSSPEYDQIKFADYPPPFGGSSGLCFSANNKHLAYQAKRGDKWFVTLDGRPSSPYDEIAVNRLSYSPIRFSPDGSRNAYFAKSFGKWNVVVDGKPSREAYPNVVRGALAFSADGRHFAYGARDDSNREFMLIDGVRSPKEITSVSSEDLLFSPDGSSFAFVANTGVVIDGKSLPSYQGVATWSLKYSPRGNHIAYEARKNNRSIMVVDGKPGPEYNSVRGLTFSPDGNHFAYEAALFQPQNDQQFLVVDDKAQPYTGFVDIIGFSPDSAHLAALVVNQKIKKSTLLIDGYPSREYDRIYFIKKGFDRNTFKCLALRDHTLYRLTVTMS